MPEASSQEITIRYDDLGSGEPALLLLPGWCVNRSYFGRLAKRAQDRRRTLALDWQGHGDSESPSGDFATEALVENAISVIEASGARQVVPVAQAHAGWVAVELRRRLGERIPALVLLSWLVLDPPPPFLAVLRAIQEPDQWQQARERLFGMWTQGVEDPAILRMVHEEMGAYGFAAWARACREVERAYRTHGSALRALAALEPPPPTLHVYALPPDQAFYEAQQAYSKEHTWFQVQRIAGVSHFPALEAPEAVAQAVEDFLDRG